MPVQGLYISLANVAPYTVYTHALEIFIFYENIFISFFSFFFRRIE